MNRQLIAIFCIINFGLHTVFSQTTLYTQSGNATDTWSFTSTGADATATTQALNAPNFSSAPKSLVVGGNTGGGSCIDGGSGNGPSTQRTFTFEEVNISSSNQVNRTLSFKWGNRQPVCTGTGWDTGENLIFIPIHNGIQQPNITLATGMSDAIFPIAQNSYNYVVPPCVNTFGFILYVSTNRRDELLFLDDVLLTTTSLNQPVTPNIVNQSFCQNQLPVLWNGLLISNAGTFNTTLTTASGCDSLVQLNVSILPISESFQQLTVCQNELPLDVNGVAINGAGTYNINYIANTGCDSLVYLTINVLPVQQSFQILTICENDLPLIINGTDIITSGTYPFPFQTASGCDSLAIFEVIVNANAQVTENVQVCPEDVPYIWNGQQLSTTGLYTSNLQTSAGCDSNVTINFLVKPIPVINFSADNTTVYIENPVVNFSNNSSNFDQFFWDFGDGSPSNMTNQPTHTFPATPGNYTVTLTASLNNCSVSESLLIVVEENADFSVDFPNIFTPNEDGANDFFTNNVTNAASMELSVFNRWGNIVFQTTDPFASWSGKDETTGLMCLEGVYIYTLRILDVAGKSYEYQNFVHLVR